MYSFTNLRKYQMERGWITVCTPEVPVDHMIDLLATEFGPVTQTEGSFVSGEVWAIRAMNSRNEGTNGEFVQRVTQVAFAPGPAATWAALRWA